MPESGRHGIGDIHADHELIPFSVSELSRAPGPSSCAACGICSFEDGVPPHDALCPLSACPKGMLNGPCGGMENGHCEVYPRRFCTHMYIRLRVMSGGAPAPGVIPPRQWRLEERRYSGA